MPSIVNTLIQSNSEVLVDSFEHVDRYIGSFGSDAVLQVLQGPWTIVINPRLQITPQKIVTGG